MYYIYKFDRSTQCVTYTCIISTLNFVTNRSLLNYYLVMKYQGFKLKAI